MRGLCVFLIVAAVLVPVSWSAYGAETGVKTFGQGAMEISASAVAAPTAAAEKPEGRLGILERRKLGLTPRNLMPIVRKALAEGRISAESPDVAAVVVLGDLQKQNPKAWSDEVSSWSSEVREVNWDNILAFLEKLIPLLIQLISLFG
jgi:hypothetical protein